MKKRKIPNPACRPAGLAFGPLDREPKERISMTADELEALYLADFEARYHEEGAEKLGVSRPTFAKILKRARKKMVEMLLFGKGLDLIAQPQAFVLVFPTDDRITIHPYFIIARYYAFATVEEGVITTIAFKENPIYAALKEKGDAIVDDDSAKGMAAGRLIPPLLKDAHILVVKSLGDGMRRNIQGLGIAIEETKENDIDAVLADLTEGKGAAGAEA